MLEEQKIEGKYAEILKKASQTKGLSFRNTYTRTS